MDSDVEIDLKMDKSTQVTPRPTSSKTSIHPKEEANRHHRYHRRREDEPAPAAEDTPVVMDGSEQRVALEQGENRLNKDADKENRSRAKSETKN